MQSEPIAAGTKLNFNVSIERGELNMAELSAKGPVEHGQHQRPAADHLVRRWGKNIILALLVGFGYFLAARLSIELVLKPEGVAVFWPAAGISSGVLIALGSRRARWPVAAGVTLATIAIHGLTADPLWAGTALGLSNAAEALITAELIELYFGTNFQLDGVVQVLGLMMAAIIGTVISGIVGAVTYRLFNGPSAALLITWEHWFASDAIGIIAVAPLVIGLAAAIRRPSPRNELVEAASTLAALAVMTGIAILMPEESWKTVGPVALLFPMLLWVAARCRPVFAAAAAFLVSMSIVTTAVFGIGHFGDTHLSMADRVAQAQAAVLFVALGGYVLAALFAERRASETRLARANMMLERERDNKLMSAQAITAAIAHEVRQPLAGIVTNASAAMRWLGRTPPDFNEVTTALKRIQTESHRTSDVFDAIRALFRTGDQGGQPVDVNAVIGEVIESLRGELKDHGVETRLDLTEMPIVDAHKGQLREVVFNLVHNALEAMDGTTERSRLLRVETRRRDAETIAVVVTD